MSTGEGAPIAREMQITATRPDFSRVRKAIINTQRVSVGRMWRNGPSYTAGGGVKWGSHCGNSLVGPQKIKPSYHMTQQLFC